MTNPMRRVLVLSLLTAVLSLCAVAAVTSAGQAGRMLQFAEANLFFELNDTDGDLGFHASIDGVPWTTLHIKTPEGRRILNIVSHGRIRAQGLTQLSFESAEPSFDELDPADFFRRFPEGEYGIEGMTQGGDMLVGTAEVSQVLAAPPGNVRVSGILAPESSDDKPLPKVSPPVVITWDPVTTPHPDLGKAGPIEVAEYQLFVDADKVGVSVELPPRVTEFEVPMDVTALGKLFTFEIIVRTEDGNNTATESCFRVM